MLRIQVDKEGNGYTAKCNHCEAWSGNSAGDALLRLLQENPELGIEVVIDEDAEYKGQSSS